jgi:hypothetical protein
MAATAVVANGFAFTFDDVEIQGIETFTPNYNNQEVDTTDFTVARTGGSTNLITGRGFSLDLDGFRKSDGSTRDAGQAAVEAKAKLLGAAAEGTLVITYPEGDTETATVNVKMKTGGGGKFDAAKWGCTFTVQGVWS